MERYLLDTNILVFLLFGNKDDISKETAIILQDFSNQLYTSSISIIELIQLYRIGKIKSKKFKNEPELIKAIEKEYFIEILPFGKEHIKLLPKIKIDKNHNDPFDQAIIAHTLTERLILVSSDRKFKITFLST